MSTWKGSLELDKYQYVRSNPHWIRLIGILGVIASLVMAYGFWNFFKLNIIYLIIFAPIVVVFIGNKFLRYLLQVFYPSFSISEHEAYIRKYWLTHDEPSVDIFLPYAGEDLRVHEQVLIGVSRLKYSNYKVYMLDDAGDESHRLLAEKYGYNYLSRPNKGVYKKSGNLEYGYTYSKGKYIFILDADFIPTRDSLRDLIPYIDQDDKIGILQTPQFFEQTDNVHNRSGIEFGGGNIVEEFYRILMPCRDEFKASMCVGTSAIYRRDTIELLEGTPKVHASEDLATGLLITRYGYYVKYLPIVSSMGTSPDNYQGYFKQHMRWCSGNLVFAEYWPKAHLNLVARLIYTINPMYYLSEAGSVIFSFQFLVLLYFHSDSLSIYNTLYFLPYIVVSQLLVPLNKVNKSKTGTKLAALNNSYTYLYTFLRMLMNNIPAWHPTGLKINGLHQDFLSAINIGVTISTLHIVLLSTVIFLKPNIFANLNAFILIAWSFYSVYWHVKYLKSVQGFIHPYRMSNATSIFSRLLVYLKTHINFGAFALLLITTTFSLFTLFRAEGFSIPGLVNTLLTSTKGRDSVLAASSDRSQSMTFTHTLEQDETRQDAARLVLVKYASLKGRAYPVESIEAASNLLLSNPKYDRVWSVGDEITFDEDIIIWSLENSTD